MEPKSEEKASETTAENMKYAPVVMQRNLDDLDLDLHLCGSLASYVFVQQPPPRAIATQTNNMSEKGGRWTNVEFVTSLMMSFYNELKGDGLSKEKKDAIEVRLRGQGFEDVTWNGIR
ncbi:hypothetical protein CGMCC3_g7967 [Colletotrichum fructicola]|uniref:Uncharacterized protein n=1 Tax=Colletotrichum fructicola (strain Nara gc5) TaxID=1213859 RepID=A0A7J6IZP9_COLFN|nr:uncharacterized protein CGMCC3_g7967 [Colletotrichum fructicola]KAE9575956.1 hypothetical protein CGMCC3_g7967 [Colletotrichum fructicola]KAF4482448.1 hypothetical protein CGGC5_v009450 [Colletotrichum fructicola Nara gc5]